MKTTEFTSTVKAWLPSPEWQTMDDLLQMVERGEMDRAADFLNYSRLDMTKHGWVEVGTATITVTLNPADLMVGKQLDALSAELHRDLADSQVRQNAIMERISKLQALTMEVAK